MQKFPFIMNGICTPLPSPHARGYRTWLRDKTGNDMLTAQKFQSVDMAVESA